MSRPWRLHRYTYADYIGVEWDSPGKHEFVDGEIYAMGGGSGEHAALMAKVCTLLDHAVGARPCRTYSADLRIFIESIPMATFPNCSVICGSIQEHEPGPDTTALNPMILVEVTSPSSEDYDFGLKRDAYRSIPSLREYMIVSHRERRITLDVRSEGGTWTTLTATRGERFELPSLQTSIEVDDVYSKSTVP
jgi:Uma2 family endonuclease